MAARWENTGQAIECGLVIVDPFEQIGAENGIEACLSPACQICIARHITLLDRHVLAHGEAPVQAGHVFGTIVGQDHVISREHPTPERTESGRDIEHVASDMGRDFRR
jgi:hypothetical protein